jgi:hypothetical protein
MFEDKGVGLILGDASGGLVDVDLDCREARMFAQVGLDPTLISGREHSPSSHWWYLSAESRTEKFFDPVAAANSEGDVEHSTLVEIRSTGAQTLVAPSLHPASGDVYRWEHLVEPEVIDAAELRENVLLIAAASLLARYWPAQGARHNAAVALAGGLLKGGSTYWQHNAAPFISAIAQVAGDEEYLLRASAVGTTLKRMEVDGRVQGWRTLAGIYGRYGADRAVWQAKEWVEQAIPPIAVGDTTPPTPSDGSGDPDALEELSLPTTDGGVVEEVTARLAPVDLIAALDAGVPEIEYVIEGLLVRGQVHGLIGYPGSGKSLLSLWMLEQAAAHGNVMYLDDENGLAETIRRIESMHISRRRLARLHYYPFPNLNLTNDNDHVALLTEIERVDPQLLVVDSMVDNLVNAGLSQNDNDEVAWFYKRFIEPLRRAGRTVLLHDHLAKHDATTTKGAGAKDELVQAVWSISVPVKFDRQSAGQIKLTRRKDRTGGLPPEAVVYVVPKNGRTRLTHLNTANLEVV